MTRELTEPQKEALELWIAELEAGHRQTKSKLVTPKGKAMCALGVRSYAYLKAMGRLPKNTSDLRLFINNAIINAYNWCPIDWVDGKRITALNDYYDMTLSEIAQWLRKEYL